jgi:ABC-type dipeptide/oligopeptide/nickel transport system ATPase component
MIEKGANMIVIEDLKVTYPQRKSDKKDNIAVNDVNLSLKSGEILGIVGESGSGKSTLINAVLNILPKKAVVEGKILYKGEELNETIIHGQYGKNIAYIPQSFSTSLSKYFKIKTQFKFFPRRKRVIDKSEFDKLIVQELSKLIDPKVVPKILNQYQFELAGGQRQRSIITMALMNEPELIIADEPTSAIDAVSRHKFIDFIMEYKNRSAREVTIIIVSHDLSLIRKVCNKIAVMKDGFLLEFGENDKIGKHPYTRLLEAVKPTFETSELPEPAYNEEHTSPYCTFSKYCDFFNDKCKEKYFGKSSKDHLCRCYL